MALLKGPPAFPPQRRSADQQTALPCPGQCTSKHQKRIGSLCQASHRTKVLHGVTSSCHAGDYLEKRDGDYCLHSCSGQLTTVKTFSMWNAVPTDRTGLQASGHLLPLETLKKILDHAQAVEQGLEVFLPSFLQSLTSSLFFPPFLPHCPFACSPPPPFLHSFPLPPSPPNSHAASVLDKARTRGTALHFDPEHHLLTGGLERILNHHVAKEKCFDKCVWSFCVLPQCPISKAVLKSGHSSPGGIFFGLELKSDSEIRNEGKR